MTFEETLIDLLKGRSRRNPITRKALMSLTGLKDRKVREFIALLQEQGKPIVCLDKGYFWGTAEEVESYKRREMKRAFTILKKLRHLIPNVGEMVRQMELGL